MCPLSIYVPIMIISAPISFSLMLDYTGPRLLDHRIDIANLSVNIKENFILQYL